MYPGSATFAKYEEIDIQEFGEFTKMYEEYQ